MSQKKSIKVDRKWGVNKEKSDLMVKTVFSSYQHKLVVIESVPKVSYRLNYSLISISYVS